MGEHGPLLPTRVFRTLQPSLYWGIEMEWHQLNETQKSHANSLVDHYNSLAHHEKDRVAGHADRSDHDAMVEWIEKAAKTIGLPSAAVGATTIGWYLIKRFKRG